MKGHQPHLAGADRLLDHIGMIQQIAPGDGAGRFGDHRRESPSSTGSVRGPAPNRIGHGVKTHQGGRSRIIGVVNFDPTAYGIDPLNFLDVARA